MLEGKAKITLTDVRTGKEEVHEQHNLVTNAIKYAYENIITGNKLPNNYILPLSTKGLGGMFLFDEELIENENNISLPSNAHIIGFCDRTTSTSCSYMGNLTPETGEIENGFKNVWEFSTTQCNGTIKSLSLTNSNFADYGIISDTFSGQYGKTVKFSNGFFYSIKFINSTTCKVYKLSTNVTGFKVSSNTYEVTAEEFLTKEIPNLRSNELFSSFDDNGYVYVSKIDSNGHGISYYTIKISDLSFDISTLSNIQLNNINLNGDKFPTYNNGYFYAIGSTNKILYKIDINSVEQPVPITISNKYFSVGGKSVVNKGNGLLAGYCYNSEYDLGKYLFYLYPDNTVFFLSDHFQSPSKGYLFGKNISNLICGEIDGFGYAAYSDIESGNPYIKDYIGTICNLNSPIVKDNTKTMKIEYSIIDS